MLCYLNSCPLNSESELWANEVVNVLSKNYRVGTTSEEIAVLCGMGYEALRKRFRNVFGCSLEQYRIQLRINAAKSMILDQNMSVKEISAELGYCDPYAFSKQFKQQVGVSPQKFKTEWKNK